VFATGVASGARVAAGVMTKTVVAEGVPFMVGPWEIVIVESTRCAATSIDGCLAVTAMREPIAVIVRHPDGDRTFGLEGRDQIETVVRKMSR